MIHVNSCHIKIYSLLVAFSICFKAIKFLVYNLLVTSFPSLITPSTHFYVLQEVPIQAKPKQAYRCYFFLFLITPSTYYYFLQNVPIHKLFKQPYELSGVFHFLLIEVVAIYPPLPIQPVKVASYYYHGLASATS